MAMQTNDPRTSLRFQGEYTESDLDALAQFTVSLLLDKRIGRATVSLAMLLAVGAVLLRSWIVAIGGFALLLALSALVRYVILPRRLVRHAGQGQGPAGSRAILLDPEAVRYQVDGREQCFGRSEIRRLALRKAHLFILFKPKGCLMLPLAWIHSPATIDQVVEFLVRRNDA